MVLSGTSEQKLLESMKQALCGDKQRLQAVNRQPFDALSAPHLPEALADDAWQWLVQEARQGQLNLLQSPFQAASPLDNQTI